VKKALRLSSDHVFFVKTDFKKFYESISHDLVMRELSRRYKDKRFLELVDKYVLNYHSDVDKELEDERRKRTANRSLYKSTAC
jgi:retron-type reverse transcriptase